MTSKEIVISRLIITLALMFVMILGSLKGEGWASTAEGLLQLEGDRLTGHLSQVTLRTVLEQLRKQLGITYEAPSGELDKVISVDLQQVPVIPALAKILAPWDYAFTVNSAGHLQFLYVTPKAPPEEPTFHTKESSEVPSSNTLAETESGSFPSGDSSQEAGDVDLALPQEQESDPTSPSASTLGSPPEQMDGFSPPMAGVPMAIQPVPAGTTMPIVPSGGSGMNVTPATSPPDMPIIPATAYPPMDIQPVPDYLQEEMLRNIQQ